METQDGFIIGVYNYCDRWCEHCSLASRCRVYAGELQLAFDGAATPGHDRRGLSPVLRSLGAVAAWLEEGLPEEVPAGAGEVDNHPIEADAADAALIRHELGPAERDLQERVQALCLRFWNWLAPDGRAQEPLVKDAVDVFQHFAVFVPPKVNRALTGRTIGEADGMLSDALGSAKAALLALDRLGDAWLWLAEHGMVSVLEAAPVLTDLQRVTAELERLFPRARDFVRPGFDEPEAVALLEWRERG